MTQRPWFVERTWFTKWLALAALGSVIALGCEQGSEGDRCNPDLVNTTECNSGLSCVTPSSCVISVCCPSSPPYTDPQCECFVHPEGCACSVDAAYDTGIVADASAVETSVREASPDVATDSGKDVNHD